MSSVSDLISMIEYRGYYEPRDVEALKMLASDGILPEIAARILLTEIYGGQDPRVGAKEYVNTIRDVRRRMTQSNYRMYNPQAPRASFWINGGY